MQHASFETLLGRSRWPLLAAALGTLDNICLDVLARGQAISSFAFLPDQMKTLDILHRNFRMASRAGAYMHEHALRPHQLPKFQIFRLAADRGYKDEFLRFCKPIHDEKCPLKPMAYGEQRWPGKDCGVSIDDKVFLDGRNLDWWRRLKDGSRGQR